MFRSGHCLHTLLPDLKMIDIVLRSSRTSFNFTQCNYNLHKRSIYMSFSQLLLTCFTVPVHFVFYIIILLYHTTKSLYFNWMAFCRINKRYNMIFYVTGTLLLCSDVMWLTAVRGNGGAILTATFPAI